VYRLELSTKVANKLSSTRWFHATTKSNYENILKKGVVVDYNRCSELDFGYGFYLTTDGKSAESYISRLLCISNEANLTTDPAVIMEYELFPLEWFDSDDYNTAIFPKFDDKFAEFVFLNRFNCSSGIQQHNYDVIYGVMSDSSPTALLLQYRADEISQEDVINGLKKGTSMKQISLHRQDLCDAITLKRAYVYDIITNERKELDIHERESHADCTA
jgi:hypothetical protein